MLMIILNVNVIIELDLNFKYMVLRATEIYLRFRQNAYIGRALRQ